MLNVSIPRGPLIVMPVIWSVILDTGVIVGISVRFSTWTPSSSTDATAAYVWDDMVNTLISCGSLRFVWEESLAWPASIIL